jgi:hypothetical protein
MSADAMERVSARTAAEVTSRYAAGEGALKRLQPGMTPRQYLDVLIEKEEFPDAARFLATALPKREAVLWATRCAERVAGENPPAPIFAALKAAEAWVAEPCEEARRAAQPAAEGAGYDTPAGTAAAAAFWSGGSLGPPDVAPIPPADHLTAHGAACAVMLAAVTTDPEKAPEKYRAFFRLGIEIAEGAHPWPEPKPKAAPTPPETVSATPRTSPAKVDRSTLNWD